MVEWKAWELVFFVFLIFVVLFVVFRPGGGDGWIKDERGVWIKQGNPSEVPEYVVEQREVIEGASQLYAEFKLEDLEIDSQCLGIVRGYAVDIVHVPRIEEDSLFENQCEDYLAGRVVHLIELDKGGEIVRMN
jgi:hypothetical protein